MTFTQLLAGVFVVLALEGLCYAMFPGAMRRAISALAAQSDERLRMGGVVAAALGIGLAWLVVGS